MYFNGSFSYLRPANVQKNFEGLTGKEIKVAVIDSGWSENLTDSRILKGKGFVNPEDELTLKISDEVTDQNGHGTGCADLIFRVAPDVKIIPLKVFGKEIETSINMLEEAFRFAIDSEVDVINVSLGTTLEEALIPIYRLCEEAKQKGIITVAAQSNYHNKSYPAVFENVISVITMSKMEYFQIEKLEDDVNEYAALGAIADALNKDGERCFTGGNSFAAPIVSGIVALLKQQNKNINLDEVREVLNKFSEESK
ncbi:MAG: S8 family serine peptidase [Rhodothermaceae bacterium]